MCLIEADDGAMVERCGRLEVVFCDEKGLGVSTVTTGTKRGYEEGTLGMCNDTFELLN